MLLVGGNIFVKQATILRLIIGRYLIDAAHLYLCITLYVCVYVEREIYTYIHVGYLYVVILVTSTITKFNKNMLIFVNVIGD